MAALFDTTAAVLLMRSRAPEGAEPLIRAARTEIEQGTAVLPSTAVTELLMGERDGERVDALLTALRKVPTSGPSHESPHHAGVMGAFLASAGASVPLPVLAIAAAAVALDLPLLTWDTNFHRSKRVAERSESPHVGADLWRRLQIHAASRGS